MVDAWEDLVERMKGESGHMYSNRYAILWADSEIAALRDRVKALEEELIKVQNRLDIYVDVYGGNLE